MTDVATRYLWTALLVAVLLAVSMFLGRLVATKSPRIGTRCVRPAAFLCGAGLLLVAGIGRLGWSIQTFDGESGPENLDLVIFWCLSIVGTALIVFDFAVGRYSK